MPSPIAHVSAGYIIFRIFKARSAHFARAGWFVFLIFAGCSLLPDVDSIFGFITADLGKYHNNITHSIIAAIPAALITFAVLWVTRINRSWLWVPVVLISYEVHLLMDFATYGRGIMAFWPFTSERFISPILLFYGLHWSEGLVSSSHLWTMLTEGVSAAAAILLTHAIMRKRAARSNDLNG